MNQIMKYSERYAQATHESEDVKRSSAKLGIQEVTMRKYNISQFAVLLWLKENEGPNGPSAGLGPPNCFCHVWNFSLGLLLILGFRGLG